MDANCLPYHYVQNKYDATVLQSDLNSLQVWDKDWLMKFNLPSMRPMHSTINAA